MKRPLKFLMLDALRFVIAMAIEGVRLSSQSMSHDDHGSCRVSAILFPYGSDATDQAALPVASSYLIRK